MYLFISVLLFNGHGTLFTLPFQNWVPRAQGSEIEVGVGCVYMATYMVVLPQIKTKLIKHGRSTKVSNGNRNGMSENVVITKEK